MTSASPSITAVIINFRTPDLLRRAVRSFRTYYPAIPLLLIDNGSHDGCDTVMRELQRQSPDRTELLLNRQNLHHGPAMDQALHHVRTQYVLFLDSDSEVVQGGFLEGMLGVAKSDDAHYAIGKKIFMNRRGFDVSEPAGGMPYIRPMCMLVHRERYLLLPPFERHGAPCLTNMHAAVDRGFAVLHFPVEEYVFHAGRGTASIHGYRLGIRGRFNHLMNRLGL
jgi:glycosyltransferase involved in cell wall biosynthesis